MMRRSRTLRALSAIRRFRSETAAASIVEFAILVPVVVFLFLGMIDFALAYNQRVYIVSLTRDLARTLAVQVDPCSVATQSAIALRADSLFVRVRSSDPLLSPYLTFEPAAGAGGACNASAGPVGARVTNYPMSSPFLRAGPFPISSRARFRWERSN